MSRKKVLLIFILLAFFSFLLVLLLMQPRARAVLRLTQAFAPLTQGGQVFCEPGAQDYAERIADALPAATARVEEYHSVPFKSGFRVYVCSTHESFTKHIGHHVTSPVRGIVFLRDIWISPKAFAFFGRDTHKQTLAHELSHLHLSQHLSWWRRVREVPSWFLEGLADWVANTGDEIVSREEARKEFLTGRHLVPDAKGKLFFPKSPQDYGLTWPLFHMQSRMFVEYLHGRDEESLKNFLKAVLGGDRFDTAFDAHFENSLENIYHDFLDSLKSGSQE